MTIYQAYKREEIEKVNENSLRRVIWSGAIGIFVEFYDYATYGLVASIIATVFFPKGNLALGILLTYGIFAITFALRPVGGIILGVIADKFGRKTVLVFTLTVMAVATGLIGLLPPYETIGIVAPIALIVLRAAQGFSAGGEMGSTMAFVGEWSQPSKRGRNIALVHMGSNGSLLFGNIFVYLFTMGIGAQAMHDWGWRVVFLIALPLGFIGFYIRNKLQESVVFKKMTENIGEERNPFADSIRNSSNRKAILIAFLAPALVGAGQYILFVYQPTYLVANFGFSSADSLLVTMVGVGAALLFTPVAGMLSDRIGRRPLMIASALSITIFAVPLYQLVTAGAMWQALLGISILGFLFSPQPGIIHCILVEQFPTRVRTTGYAIGYNIGIALFGGAAPLIVTALIEQTGAKIVPALFVAAAALFTTAGVFIAKETKGVALD